MLGALEVLLPRALRPRAVQARAELAASDARMLLARLRGEHPAPFHPRTGSGLPASAIRFRRLEVVEVIRETEDAVRIVLEDAAGRPFEHVPGQFLTLLVPVAGEIARRAYSIAWASEDLHRVAVGVRRVAGGRVSTHLSERLRPGERLDALGPSGGFVHAAEDGPVTVLIGGGSGITPLLRLAAARLTERDDAQVALVLGNRCWDSVMFRADIDGLVQRHGGRLQVRHVLDDAGATDPARAALAGPLRRDVLHAALIDVPFSLADATWFVCGPAGMMDEARAFLAARRVPPARVREERFVTVERAAATTSAQRVTFRLPGGATREVVARAGATLLEAGLEAGVALPYSCAMGGCGACRVRASGPTAISEASCLAEYERAAGDVLACCTTPAGHVTVEVPA
jgi:ring-1,2-phenylacetyl-CoA epoxidase subunit PaaE